MKIFLVAGARPNFMKIAPIYSQMKLHSAIFDPVIIHTGQHYDENMSKVFFDDLELPRPDIYLGVGSGSHAEQTAEIMKRFEPELLQHKPDLVLVVGDVNSTIACALAAIKIRIPSESLTGLWEHYEEFFASRDIGKQKTEAHRLRIQSHDRPIIAHVEAGERSFDFSMPEEINRVTTDVLSDLLFTTHEFADKHLIAEGVDSRKIFCVGNVMIDSLQTFLPKAKTSTILKILNKRIPAHFKPLTEKEFALVTLHRPGNVDDPAVLKMLLSAFCRISVELPVIFPMHPRTRKLMADLGEDILTHVADSHVFITDPIGYLDFLHLQTQARLILTDSGGIQVESSYLGVPCLTLRPNTEWRITLREGANRLVPIERDKIVTAFKSVMNEKTMQKSPIPLWDGKTAKRIIRVMQDIVSL